MQYAEEYSAAAAAPSRTGSRAASSGGGGAAAVIAEEYFASYDDLNVHQTMLHDEPRMAFYRDAIAGDPAIRGSVVLDAGAGTGVLSLFAALYGGARRVIAVEASAFLCDGIRRTLRQYPSDVQARIHVVHSALEDVSLASLRRCGALSVDDDAVDFIVSEWIGFYLLHERMLQSVVACRRQLASPSPNGTSRLPRMIPNTATLYVALVDVEPLKDAIRRQWTFAPSAPGGGSIALHGFAETDITSRLSKSPLVEVVPPACVIGGHGVVGGDAPSGPHARGCQALVAPSSHRGAKVVACWDLEDDGLTPESLDVVVGQVRFAFSAPHTAAAPPSRTENDTPRVAGGVIIWFDVAYDISAVCPAAASQPGTRVSPPRHVIARLDTSPFSAPTHWKQTLVLFPDGASIPVADLQRDGDVVGVHLRLSCAEGSRCYDIQLELFDGAATDAEAATAED
mgnify:CR=1 FL=1